MVRNYGLMLLALFVARAAATEEEIVANGGFETGQLTPWVAEKFVVGGPGGGHTGEYEAGMASWGDPAFIEGYIRQDLGRTYYPGEVKGASFWIYPDFHGRGAGRAPCDTFFVMKLGDNNAYSEHPVGTWGWLEQWYQIEMPLDVIQYAFDYVYIWVRVASPTGFPPYNLYVALDDVSVTISHTGVTPASWGRVKATFR